VAFCIVNFQNPVVVFSSFLCYIFLQTSMLCLPILFFSSAGIDGPPLLRAVQLIASHQFQAATYLLQTDPLILQNCSSFAAATSSSSVAAAAAARKLGNTGVVAHAGTNPLRVRLLQYAEEERRRYLAGKHFSK
jgi:hypothetical protein